MSVVGALKVLLSIDTAQLVSDTGKARAAVRSAVGDMQRGGATAMAALTRDIGAVGPALRGLQPATMVGMKALELLGEKGSTVVTGLLGGLGSLARGGFTPLSLAAGAAVTAMSLLARETPRVESAFAGTEERAKAAAVAIEKLRTELAFIAAGGRPGDAGAELRGLSVELDSRRAEQSSSEVTARDRLVRGLGGAIPGVTSRQEDLAVRTADQQHALDQEEIRIALAADLAAATKRRADEEAAAARKRAEAAQAAVRADQEDVASTKALIDLTRQLAEVEADRAAQVRALESGADVEVARQTARVARAQAAVRRAEFDQAGGDEMSRRTAELDHERKMLGLLERERATKVTGAEEVLVVHEDLSEIDEWILEMQQDRAYLTREETEELERQRKVAEDLGEEMQAAWLRGREVLDAARAAESEQFSRAGPGGGPSALGGLLLDESQRSLTDGMARSFQDLARGATSAQGAIRSFALSFVDAMQQIAAQQAAIALVKAAFAAFGYGSPSSSQLASGPAPAVNVTSTLPTAAAHGGAWRVGGFGGLDSQTVRMKLSPGELVRVSDGANRGRGDGGGFHGTLVVRPPAVVANEVAARMDPRAKASIVASATARPGRRADRAAG